MPAVTIVFLIALSTLVGVHVLALQFFLYWHYVWLDVPVHFFGGSVVMLGAFAFANISMPYFNRIISSRGALFVYLVSVMVAWELFEFLSGVPIRDNFIFDTSLDLISGFFGGVTGYLVAHKLKGL